MNRDEELVAGITSATLERQRLYMGHVLGEQGYSIIPDSLLLEVVDQVAQLDRAKNLLALATKSVAETLRAIAKHAPVTLTVALPDERAESLSAPPPEDQP